MSHRLISGDNHIDLTYLPADLWSSQAPHKWKLVVPRVEELEDGLHWFVEAQDKGMWNGVGPAFFKYVPGYFAHVDEMKQAGFDWDNRPGARPRPTTPDLRLADLDRDGLHAEIVYGCLTISDMIANPAIRNWAIKIYNDWAIEFARRTDPARVFPLAIVPSTGPAEAAAEIRRCAAMGLRGGDLAFKHARPVLYHRDWDAVWSAAAECHFPISFHSTGFKVRAPETPESQEQYAVPWRFVHTALFQTDSIEVLASLLASGACERFPGFRFVLAESGVTWLPYAFDRLDTVYHDRARALGFSLKPSDYFRRQGYATYQQDQYLDAVIPIVGEDNIIWGADYPHADSVWPNSRSHIDRNLGHLPERVQRKITSENVAALYGLP